MVGTSTTCCTTICLRVRTQTQQRPIKEVLERTNQCFSSNLSLQNPYIYRYCTCVDQMIAMVLVAQASEDEGVVAEADILKDISDAHRFIE